MLCIYSKVSRTQTQDHSDWLHAIYKDHNEWLHQQRMQRSYRCYFWLPIAPMIQICSVLNDTTTTQHSIKPFPTADNASTEEVHDRKFLNPSLQPLQTSRIIGVTDCQPEVCSSSHHTIIQYKQALSFTCTASTRN